MKPYAKMISIGSTCQVAHQLRRRPEYGSSPMDWTGTPLASVSDYVGLGFYGPLQNGVAMVKRAGRWVARTKCGLVVSHEFNDDRLRKIIAKRLGKNGDIRDEEIKKYLEKGWQEINQDLCLGMKDVAAVKNEKGEWCMNFFMD